LRKDWAPYSPKQELFAGLRRVPRPRTDKYAILLIRDGCSCVAGAHSRRGAGSQVQAEEFHDSIRPGLIAMLPRLKRFADLLVGERSEATALLCRALQLMLAEQHRYQMGRALDSWAFAEIYRQWLAELGDYDDPVGRAKIDEASFAELFGDESDALTTGFLASLPVQQRLTLLLVYGERLDYAEAGHVLDVSADVVAARLIRISATFADRLRIEEQPLSTRIDARYSRDRS
jgi:RNA polymerase sigma-70 factor, ECF subfamily